MLVNPSYAKAEEQRKKLLKRKPAKCSHCGERRIIEFVCVFSGSSPIYYGVNKKENQLCKKCTNWRNSCKHGYCWQNYEEADELE